jgi:hypothetical protein
MESSSICAGGRRTLRRSGGSSVCEHGAEEYSSKESGGSSLM